MSRVAKQILSTKGVTFSQNDNILTFKGPIGSCDVKLHQDIKLNIDKEKETIGVDGDTTTALKGTFVRLIQNAIIGTSKGFEKKIKLSGVGYKVAVEGNKLRLTIGLSHEKYVDIPENIKVTLPNIVNIVAVSANKEHLGMFADKVCRAKKYNVYNGSGILDLSKFYIRKETKKK